MSAPATIAPLWQAARADPAVAGILADALTRLARRSAGNTDPDVTP